MKKRRKKKEKAKEKRRETEMWSQLIYVFLSIVYRRLPRLWVFRSFHIFLFFFSTFYVILVRLYVYASKHSYKFCWLCVFFNFVLSQHVSFTHGLLLTTSYDLLRFNKRFEYVTTYRNFENAHEWNEAWVSFSKTLTSLELKIMNFSKQFDRGCLFSILISYIALFVRPVRPVRQVPTIGARAGPWVRGGWSGLMFVLIAWA